MSSVLSHENRIALGGPWGLFDTRAAPDEKGQEHF